MACGRGGDEPLAQVCGDELPRSVVADSALDRAEHLGMLATRPVQWITRVPATLNEVQAPLAHVERAPLRPLPAGSHYREVSSSFGGGEQRWCVVYAEARHQRGQRPVDTQRAKPSDTERTAVKQRCAQPFACAADARQALEQGKAT